MNHYLIQKSIMVLHIHNFLLDLFDSLYNFSQDNIYGNIYVILGIFIHSIYCNIFLFLKSFLLIKDMYLK